MGDFNNGHDLAMALRAAYLSMHREADSWLSRFDLTAAQFVVLALLAEQGNVPQCDLVQRATSDKNTIRSIVILLKKRGLLTREPNPDDGRAWVVRLTDLGNRTFKKVSSENQRFHERLLSALQPAEVESLIYMLDRIADTMKSMNTASNGRLKKHENNH